VCGFKTCPKAPFTKGAKRSPGGFETVETGILEYSITPFIFLTTPSFPAWRDLYGAFLLNNIFNKLGIIPVQSSILGFSFATRE
jgi:hypothetical protein